MTQELSNFYFRKESNNYRSECKDCFKKMRKEYRKENYEKVTVSKKKYYYDNREKCCERSKDWYEKNKELVNIRHTKYIRLRRQTDVEFKIYSNIQNRIYLAIKNYDKNNIKKDNTSDIIGCSIQFYKTWLEFQFDTNMNWNNHGTYWHIDHVKPCASFNLLDETEIKQCFSWKNVRPVEKTANLIKNDTIDMELLKKHSETVENYLLLKLI
jgi:hypothetical protein